MKIIVCDICNAYGPDRFKIARRRYGYSGGIKIDVCEEHRNWGNQFKGLLAFEAAVVKLHNNQEHSDEVIEE